MNKSKVYPWYFAAGALLIYTIFSVIPGLIGIGYSFTDWSAYSKELHFVGLKNFAAVVRGEGNYLHYITNTLLFTLVTTVSKTVLGLLFAVALSEGIKFKNFHRGVMYLPSVLPILVIGLTFTSILNPKVGFLNTFLRSIGLDFLAQKWLVDPKIAFGSVLNVIYGLKVFDMVYALTNGGPGHRTEVMYTAVFKMMSKGLYAEGTTISSIMFVFMVIIGYFMVKILTKDEVVE